LKDSRVVSVGIVGVSGYTGRELLRILQLHAYVRITEVYGETSAGRRLHEVYPFLDKNTASLEIKDFFKEKHQAEFYFICVHHGKAQELVASLVEEGKKVIDLSADFRLKSAAIYEKTYGVKHKYPGLLETAVYGLPEIYREEIRQARLVANPGCLARAAILSLYPLLREEMVDVSAPIIIDAKTGTSGAGRGLREDLHFPHMNENFKPYAALYHRHQPEIEQELSFSTDLNISFVPHLLPVDRGILVSSYVSLKANLSKEQIAAVFKKVYAGEAFISVLLSGYPELKGVRGTNNVHVGFQTKDRRAVIFVALDNLLSGASGTAVHNFNLMAGFEEKEGLSALTPLYP